MTCERMREWIIDELAGELTEPDRRAFQDHLEACDACTETARQYRELWSDLPAATELPEPGRGLAQLQAKVAEEFGRSGLQIPGWKSWLTRAAAASILVGLGVVGGIRLESTRAPDSTATSDADDVVDDRPRFVLLFYQVPGDAAARARASEDISTWARGLFRQGVVETGAEMTEEAAWAGPSPGSLAGEPRITFYIRIRAADLETARQIAATAPVTAYGGVIEVRPLDP